MVCLNYTRKRESTIKKIKRICDDFRNKTADVTLTQKNLEFALSEVKAGRNCGFSNIDEETRIHVSIFCTKGDK